MTSEELKIKITELLPSVTYEEGGDATGWLNMNVPPSDWLDLATKLKSEPSLQFDYLFCCTCIDWKTHLTMVYHLSSTVYRHNIVFKATLDRNKPEIETVSFLWRTAEFHEREVYEMFGVNFFASLRSETPDFCRMDGKEKNPLRKDFEDPVNMIRL